MRKLEKYIRTCACIGNIPSSYIDAMSYEEQTLWLCKFLDEKVLPVINQNSKDIEDLQNLDVQDEVNKKLDEMAESGQLTDIIAQYLQLAGVLVYNNLNDFKNASNIVNGSVCKTLGNINYNDGKGAYYKIRTITSSDVVDDINIIRLNVSNTLIGEKINNYYINNLENRLSLIENKKYLLVGDSYAVGYQPGLSNITGYYDIVINKLNLDATIICQNGYGFSGNQHNKKWKDLINNANITNKELYTDIIICGGMNDSTVYAPNEIDDCITYLKQNFINANIHIGMISHFAYINDATELNRIIDIYKIYKQKAIENGCSYINNSENILHDVSWFYTDQIHPNEDGETALANGIMEYITSGNINVLYPYKKANIEESSNVDLSGFNLYTFMENNTCRIIVNGSIKFNTGVQLKNITPITLGKIKSGYIKGSPSSQGISTSFETYVWDATANAYRNIRLSIRNTPSNDLIITPFTILQNGGSVTINNVTEIGIAENMSSTIPSLYC